MWYIHSICFSCRFLHVLQQVLYSDQVRKSMSIMGADFPGPITKLMAAMIQVSKLLFCVVCFNSFVHLPSAEKYLVSHILKESQEEITQLSCENSIVLWGTLSDDIIASPSLGSFTAAVKCSLWPATP